MTQASQQLIILEKLNPVDLFKPNGLDSVLKEVDEKARSVILAGVETKQDRDNIRAIAAKVGSTKSTLQKIGTKYTEKMRSAVKESNAERDRGVTILQSLQDDIREPLTKYEEAEKQRTDDADRAIECLSLCNVFENEELTVTSKDISTRIDKLNLLYENLGFSKFSESDQEKYSNRANHMYEQTRTRLQNRYEIQIKYESDQKELAELKEKQAAQIKKDEENRIRQEAADKARHEADEKARIERESSEKAAADLLAAEKEKSERIEREKQEALDAAKKAEQDRIAAEKKSEADKTAAVQAEKDRADAEKLREKQDAEKREADKTHRAKINNESLNAIANILNKGSTAATGKDMAKDIVAAIAEGKITHVTISY